MQAYDAFISYSHRADRLTARTLQRGLENFNRKWLGRRRLQVFRDETDLSLAPSLWGVIQEALDSSRFFILLASPQAAKSEWVDKEVKRWLETKPARNILLVVTDGTFAWNDAQHDFDRSASSAIPRALFGAFSEEPLFLDLRGIELRKYRSTEVQAAIASVAAPIHGKTKQELLGLEVQLVRRRLFVASVALVLIAVFAAGFLFNFLEASRQRDEASRQRDEASRQKDEASRQRDVARSQRDRAQSQLAATRSGLALQNRQASPAFWDAVESWNTDPNWVAQKALYDFAHTGLHATLANPSNVSYATLSRDGLYAATVSVGFKLWKTDGTAVSSAGIGGAVGGGSVDFAADGSGVAFSGSLRPAVFDNAGVKQFELPTEDLEGNVWFSPDSRYLFTAASGRPTRRWDRAGRQLNEYRHKGHLNCLAASADGSMVAGGTDGGEIYLWSVDGSALRTFRERTSISSIEFSQDGSRLVSVTRNGSLSILSTSSATSRTILEQGAFGAAISPQGDQIGVMDGRTIRLMNLNGDTLRTLKDEGDAETEPRRPEPTTRVVDYRRIGRSGEGAIRFLAGGRSIVTSAEGATQVWDLDAGRVIKRLEGKLLAASPNESYLVTPGKYSALVWEANNALRSEIPHESGISAFGLASVDGALVTASFDGNARIWDAAGNYKVSVAHGAPLTSAIFSHDGLTLLTVGRDSTVRLWSRAGALQRAFHHGDIVNHAAFAPDDRHIVTNSADGTAVIWSLDEERSITLDHKSEVYDAVYSPDGQLLATSAADHTLRVWSTVSGSLRWQQGTPEAVPRIVFSPDGQKIIAATTGTHLLMFEAQTGHLLADVIHPDTHMIIAAEVAPTGDFVVTSATDRIVRVWDQTGQRKAQFETAEPVETLAISRDGMRILTGSKGGLAQLWDPFGNELIEFSDAGEILQARFSPDGNSVVTASPRRVRIWNFGSPASIISHYQNSIGRLEAEFDQRSNQAETSGSAVSKN